jgi:hypothetical protein
MIVQASVLITMQDGKKFFLGPSVANFGAPVESKQMNWDTTQYVDLVRCPAAVTRYFQRASPGRHGLPCGTCYLRLSLEHGSWVAEESRCS